MLILYRVSYVKPSDHYVLYRDFNLFFKALDFTKEIRQSGGRANLLKIPLDQCN